MREKLIEILKTAPFGGKILDYWWFEETVAKFADFLIQNGVTIPVRCKGCKHWNHMEDGCGDCTNPRFHLPGHADPTMEADGFCLCGERKSNE